MFVAALAALIGCTSDEETTYTQFNAEDNSVLIEVGVDTVYETDDNGDAVYDDDGEPVPMSASVTLTSTSGEYDVGTATVTPSAGPIGTTHTVMVEVDSDYTGDVDRASVRTDSGDRGEDEYDLDEDSAQDGLFVLELVSYGESGETREDTLTFRLWTADESSSDGGSDSGGFSIF